MKPRDVMKMLDISRMTLHNYVKLGKIRVKEKENRRFDYNRDDVFKLMNRNEERKNIVYARVSSQHQKNDLQNQLETLRNFCAKNGIVINEEYSDICSGLNLERKNFQKMLDEITDFKVKTVYITYKDRLTRLSYNVFKELFSKYGTDIIVLNEVDNPKEIEKEIFEEIITLVHTFSTKMYSQRKQEKLSLMEKELRLESEV